MNTMKVICLIDSVEIVCMPEIYNTPDYDTSLTYLFECTYSKVVGKFNS